MIKWMKKKFIYFLVISILVFISFLYFSTFNNETDKNNIYYIFSTSAQTLAALVGFVLTAYIFTYQNLRNIKEEDETLIEIIEGTIEKYYKFIFILSSYSAVVLIANILMLQLNMIGTWPYRSLAFIVVAMLNVVGILIAFGIALYILRPFREKEWARSILKEDKEIEIKVDTGVKTGLETINEGETKVLNIEKDTVDGMLFIEKFVELERIIRDYTDEKFQFNERTSLRKRLDYLSATQKLSDGVIGELLAVIKYRNLAVHGRINKIDRKVYEVLVELLDEVKKNLNK